VNYRSKSLEFPLSYELLIFIKNSLNFMLVGRERDFVIVSDRPTSLTIAKRTLPFLTVSELFMFSGLKNFTNVRKWCKMFMERSGTLNGQERLGTNSGKRSRSRFINEGNTACVSFKNYPHSLISEKVPLKTG
jgi:hypothetical protein